VRGLVHGDGRPYKALQAGPPRVAVKTFLTAHHSAGSVVRDPARVKNEVLGRLLAASLRQLQESEEFIGEIISIMHWAKTPRERTAMNIILDDQKKASKALLRLTDDLTEMIEKG
jgi:hypothetical protein